MNFSLLKLTTMNYPKILLLACLIIGSAVLSCQKDEPAFEIKTFEATFYTDLDSLVPDSVTCEGAENLLNTQKGSGSEPTVGSFTTTMAFCFNTDTFEYGNTEASFVAADGDELFLDVSGQVVPTTEPGYDLEFKDPFTIIGGTGRFEGASGSGATESYVNMTTGRTDHVWKGTITLKK